MEKEPIVFSIHEKGDFNQPLWHFAGEARGGDDPIPPVSVSGLHDEQHPVSSTAADAYFCAGSEYCGCPC